MSNFETAVAVFPDHEGAERAVKTLTSAGFDMKNLTVVGKGYHSEEKVTGFYNAGDRIKFWGSRGAFWGGLWGLFFGGLFIATPVAGPIFVVGFLATMAASAVLDAVLVGGLSALGAALYGIGIPKNSVLSYESDIKADKFLVMARGSDSEVERAKTILQAANASRVEIHGGAGSAAEAKTPLPAVA